MARLNRGLATLRIIGDELVPSEISAALGCEPTRGFTKGDVLGSSRRRGPRTATFGMWTLEATDTEPADVDAQVAEILDQLPNDPAVWAALRSTYNVNLFCGWFMDRLNEGVSMEPETLSALGNRGILLDIDLYGGLDGDSEE